MTLATVGAGVFDTPDETPTLGQQVDTFKGLMYDGFISSTRLDGAFLLVAISGNDYIPKINLFGNTSTNSIIPLTPYIENVTNEIVANVHRLQKLGAQKILVNNMHPLGCMPRHTRVNNHTRCESHGNLIATAHNSMLQQKLGNNSNVLIVDLYTAFTNVINNQTPDSQRFTFKLAPSCEANDPEGFCGYRDGSLDDFYMLDEDHLFKHFYWDDMHPTSAGWKAVMKQLEGSIKSFMS
ncbi:hypothetical protein ACQ4PT_063253 [Festuca glaucescens]